MSDRPTAEEDGLLVKVLAEVLQKLVATNARQGPDADRVTKFHALKPPSISEPSRLGWRGVAKESSMLICLRGGALDPCQHFGGRMLIAGS